MFRLGLVLAPLFGLLLFRFPSVSIEPLPGLSHNWSFELDREENSGSSHELQLLWKEGAERFIYRAGSYFSLPDEVSDQRLFVPHGGKGYFVFQRMGKEIQHRSPSGELYWKRESSAYPVSSPDGSIVLLITGDSNRVDVMDRNGIVLKESELNGSLLVDYSFSHSVASGARAAVLFSDGRYYILGENGKLLLSSRISEKPVFARSLALSENGNALALHFEQEGKDHLALYALRQEDSGMEMNRRFDLELESNYPYTVPMNVHEDTILFAPPGLSMSVNDGEILLRRSFESGNGLHRALYFGPKGGLMQEENRMLILNEKGELLGLFGLSELLSPARLMRTPGPDMDGGVIFHSIRGEVKGFQFHSSVE